MAPYQQKAKSKILYISKQLPVHREERDFLHNSLFQSTREAFVLHHWDVAENQADNILINGKGRINKDQKDINKNIDESNNMPLATFVVKKGFRYRFRMSSPGFTLCPIVVSIENHSMTLIDSDSASLKPIKLNSFIIHPGER